MGFGRILQYYQLKNKLDRFRLFLVYRKKLVIPKTVMWRRNFTVHMRDNGQISIGENCFFNNDLTIFCKGTVSIGDWTICGENVKIYDHDHRFNRAQTPFQLQGDVVGEVIIGENCWIASNVTLLRGTRIGKNCVIAAGCVVSGEIPDNTIVRRSDSQFVSEPIRFKTEDS